MRRRRTAQALLAASALAATLLLAGCAPEPGATTAPTDAAQTPGVSTGGPTASASPTGTPTPEPTPVALPTDCRAILDDSVLAQLADVPLNDPAFGPSGVQGDTLRCIWADPRADTTSLTTTISRMNRGPALDMLNELADGEGFTCYTPDHGTRCEKTWQNAQYPVTDGRTLFWRDGILIDTQYSNLAPTGYTGAIIASLWG